MLTQEIMPNVSIESYLYVVFLFFFSENSSTRMKSLKYIVSIIYRFTFFFFFALTYIL